MKYFTIKELSHSDTAVARGIDNYPTAEAIHNLTKLVENVLDPLREKYGKPIRVSSGYRSAILNRSVNGATFPYGKDPKDSNIRIAPSFPTPEDMALAADIFVLCVKLVSIDKILESK